MSILFRARRDAAGDLIPARSSTFAGSVRVDADSALRHSAVWACLRLRADLISTLPLDVYRRNKAGVQEPIATPLVLRKPDGFRLLSEWLYASQMDLDRFGNAFGFTTWVNGAVGAIELIPASSVAVLGKGQKITGYRVGGVEYSPDRIWHERQFTPPGIPVGLAPLTYAASSIGGYLSAQQFALDWFGSGAQPSGTLRNTEEATLSSTVIGGAKARFKEATAGRDLFVTGKDWEFLPAVVDGASSAFLDEMQFGIADVARFLGVPGDLIGAETSTGSITYASITQRNLQLLIMNLGPAIKRREDALSEGLYGPWYVKLNADALLRMDPQQRATLLSGQVAARLLAPSEARELENREPFTPEQVAEFAELFGDPNRTPKPAVGGAA